MIFATIYTPEYSEIVRNLAETALKHNMTLLAKAVESRGSWAQNVLLKLPYLQWLNKTFSETVVFLDADAEIVRDPSMMLQLHAFMAGNDSPISMAWYPLPMTTGVVRRNDTRESGRWDAGTILMTPGDEAREILDRAEAIVESGVELGIAPEEYALCQAICESGRPHEDLPRQLCQVFDKPHNADLVRILQNQKSRFMRDKVGR